MQLQGCGAPDVHGHQDRAPHLRDDETHLARLELIARLQEQGFSLASIARLLATWTEGRDLLTRRHAVVIEASELLDQFPPGALTPAHVERAVEMGLVEAADDERST